MTASPLPRPDAVASPSLQPEEPVALLQLDGARTAEAASAVYREVRRGRRVVAVVSGPGDAAARLAARLDAIGVDAARPGPGEALLTAGVAIVDGPETAAARPVASERRLRVALAGCGVVGGGVLERLSADPRFETVGVLVRDPRRPRDPAPAPELIVTDPSALLARDPDVLVEAISDASTGLALIRAALSRGVDVVSADKQAVGADLAGLEALAVGCGSRLAVSACVGGGAPLVETVRRARAHAPVTRIEAVLNGTSNYILNRLAEGEAFDDALEAARQAGFAEADPTADLSGLDAAAKLAILAHEAGAAPFRTGDVRRDAIARGAAGAGAVIRQIARLDVVAGTAEVVLEPVGDDPLLARLPDEWNALRVTTVDGRTFSARGRGAGRLPTAESVWADLTDLAG